MAEREMTGDEHGEASDLSREPEVPGLADPAGPGLARRAGHPARTGRPDFDGLDADLAGLAGGRGDLANLPPWSARDERAGGERGTDRPDRDPVALAAWRRVAERRRRRALGDRVVSDAVRSDPGADELLADALAGAVLAGGDGPGDRAADARAEEHSVEDLPADRRPAGEEPADVRRERFEVDRPGREVDDVTGDEAGGDRAGDPRGAETDDGTGATSTADGRDAYRGPPERPADAPPARGGRDPRPGTPPPARPDPGGRHEVLLSLAGRIDDDALSTVRELVAVEDDAGAAELLGGCLLAAGAGVTAREHAILGRWFAGSRVDPELVDALPLDPEADARDEHRFTADPPSGVAATGGAGESVARAAARLPGVQRVLQCWRTTPAGSAPGPVPHRVVLVETYSVDDCEHVAHHVAHAARELGVVSVEVFAAGAVLPAYHRAAVRAARPLGTVAARAETVPPPSAAVPAPSTPVADEVPSFGVPATGTDPAPDAEWEPTAGNAEGPASTAADDVAEDVTEHYRTVAVAGRDPLDRADRPDPEERGPDAAEPDAAGPGIERPAAPPEPETVAPEAPAPLDLDPRRTAARIAALWRTPPPDEILSDQHPISSWAEAPIGVTFGPDDEPAIADTAPGVGPTPGTAGPAGDVDPDAVTGDVPVTGETPSDDPPAGRVRRSRHRRAETGELEMPVVPPGPFPTSGRPATGTNGHHHGSDRLGASRDDATGPVRRPGGPAGPGPQTPGPPPSGPDSIDSQLSERERELLARLHEELASRERLDADAPDPLLGRPPQAAPGPEQATDPGQRPTGPHTGRPPGPYPGPHGAAGINGTGLNGRPHGPVNGHGLPRQSDDDGEDGTSRDA